MSHVKDAGPKGWGAEVPTLLARVRYADVHSGVDLVFRGDGGRLEHEPVADPGRITLALAGEPKGRSWSSSGSGTASAVR